MDVHGLYNAEPCVGAQRALRSHPSSLQWVLGASRRGLVGGAGRIVVMSSVGDLVVRQDQRGPWQRPTSLAFGAEASVLADCGASRRHGSQHIGVHPARLQPLSRETPLL